MIIPCHNSIRYLDDCWESIYTQSIGLSNMQVIFVDDASTDNTVEYLERYKKEAPDSVSIIRLRENRRQGGARNEALKYVKGEYIRFLDSDDIILPNSNERLYQKAKKYNVDIIQFNQCTVDNKQGSVSELISTNELIEIAGTNEVKRILYHPKFSCTHHSKFYRADFVKRVGTHFAEKRIYEEPLFVYPMVFYTKSFLFLAETHYAFRQHEESTMSKDAGKRLIDLPCVMLELLKDVVKRGLLKDYYDEIEEYFLRNYYALTLYNMFSTDSGISLEQFKEIQNNCREFFPDRINNPYLKQGAIRFYEGIDMEFKSVDEIIKHRNGLGWS